MADAEQIVAESFENFYPRAVIQKLTIHGPAAGQRMELQVAQRTGERNALLVRGLHPDGVPHFLITERDGFMYEVIAYLGGKTRRLAGPRVDGVFPGASMRMEDLVPRRADDVVATTLRQDVLAGRPVHVIEMRPGEGVPSAYDRIEGWFADDAPLMLRADLVGGVSGAPSQVVQVDPDSIEEVGGLRIATRSTIESAGETRAIEASEIEVRDSLPDKLFRASWLKKHPSRDRSG